jgi:hypothetical protein
MCQKGQTRDNRRVWMGASGQVLHAQRSTLITAARANAQKHGPTELFPYFNLDSPNLCLATELCLIWKRQAEGHDDLSHPDKLCAIGLCCQNTVICTPHLRDSADLFPDVEGDLNDGTLTASGVPDGDVISVRDQGAWAGKIGFSE